jgi:Mor family transcriptional regulator
LYNWKNTQTPKLFFSPTVRQRTMKKDFDTMNTEELEKKYKKETKGTQEGG